MTKDQARYDDIEKLLRESLMQVEDHISDSDHKDVAEYLDFGEYGVAYELLIFVLDKGRIDRPDSLREAGQKMGMKD